MWVAPPIVSADAIFRTRLFNFYIFELEKLSEIVTARGRPSGMATTTTVIAIITDSSRDGYTELFKSPKSYSIHVPSNGFLQLNIF